VSAEDTRISIPPALTVFVCATDENDIVSSAMNNMQALFILKHRLIFRSDAQHIKIHILLSCSRIL